MSDFRFSDYNKLANRLEWAENLVRLVDAGILTIDEARQVLGATKPTPVADALATGIKAASAVPNSSSIYHAFISDSELDARIQSEWEATLKRGPISQSTISVTSNLRRAVCSACGKSNYVSDRVKYCPECAGIWVDK